MNYPRATSFSAAARATLGSRTARYRRALLGALIFLVVSLVDPVAAADPFPCIADDDGALYVEWKAHRLKVWPNEIAVKQAPGAGAQAEVRCYDKPISAYTFTRQPSIWENPEGGGRDGNLGLSHLQFFVLSPSSKARLASPRAAARAFDRACHEVRYLQTQGANLRIQYCELAVDHDPSSKRYTFVDYTPDGAPLTLFCQAYRARGIEFCEVEYAIDSTLIVRYAFNSLRVKPEKVINIDRALREQFARRISSFD